MKRPGYHTCHQDQHVITSGLNRPGSQCSRCQACRRSFTPDPKPEGYDVPVRTQALKRSREGTRFRTSGRLLERPHQTVSTRITQAAAALPAQITDWTPRACRQTGAPRSNA